jgi:hypothetical protein
MAAIGIAHSEVRAAAVSALADALAHHAVQDREFNSLVVGALIDLQATEAAHVIARAFDADDIDPTFAGDWEDVQVRLGLLDARLTPRPDYFAQGGASLPSVRADLRRSRERERQSAARGGSASSSRKAAGRPYSPRKAPKPKRRQAEQSRRRNRRQ